MKKKNYKKILELLEVSLKNDIDKNNLSSQINCLNDKLVEGYTLAINNVLGLISELKA